MTPKELESVKEAILDSGVDFYSAQNYMNIEGDLESAESVEQLQHVADDLEEWASILEDVVESIRDRI